MNLVTRKCPYLETAKLIYDVANHNPLLDHLPPLPQCLEPSVKLIYEGAGKAFPGMQYRHVQYPAPAYVDERKFVLGMTGGNDSLAVALQLLKEERMRGVVVHIRGINPAYEPRETEAAKEQARHLGMLFVEVKVRVKKEYLECPARNHAILFILASVAYRHGASVLALGLHQIHRAEWQMFETGWSDCAVMAVAGKQMIESAAPWIQNRIYGLPLTGTASIRYVLKHAPSMIRMVSSCMTPARAFAGVRKMAERIAGYGLLPNRCGSCYKCCREWLVLRGEGEYPPSPQYEEWVKDRLVHHSTFVYGPAAREWPRDLLISRYLSDPSEVVVTEPTASA